MPGTRSGTTGSTSLTPAQRAAVQAAFGGDQVVAARMIGIMEGTTVQAPAIPQNKSSLRCQPCHVQASVPEEW